MQQYSKRFVGTKPFHPPLMSYSEGEMFFVCWFIFKITVLFKSIGIILSYFSWFFKEYISGVSISERNIKWNNPATAAFPFK